MYLRAGTALVLVVDPKKRAMSAHDAENVMTFTVDDTFRHGALPDFELQLGPLFARALDLPH